MVISEKNSGGKAMSLLGDFFKSLFGIKDKKKQVVCNNVCGASDGGIDGRRLLCCG